MTARSHAENAATVREALEKLRSAGRTSDILKVWCDDALDGVAALLAQAEAAEMYKADRDSYDELLGRKMAERDEWHKRAKSAEAERDTFKRGVNENARMVDEQRERAEAAERAAEQAQTALRSSTDFLVQTFGNHSLAANAIIEQSRAALTGDGTE